MALRIVLVVVVDPIAAVVVRRTGLEVDIVGSALELARSLADTVAVGRRALAAISTYP